MSAINDRDSNNRDHTPSPKRCYNNDSFSIFHTQSSAKKAHNTSVYGGAPVPFSLLNSDKPSGPGYLGPLSGHGDLMQSKIEHLEKERVELTLQLHRKDEKDRDRKLRLEQVEFKLRSAEQESVKASAEAVELRDQVYRLTGDKDELAAEISRLQKELQNTSRCEAMDVWKKMTATARELKRVEEELLLCSSERSALAGEHRKLLDEVGVLGGQLSCRDAEVGRLQQMLAEQAQAMRNTTAETQALQEATEASYREQIASLLDQNAVLAEQLAADKEIAVQQLQQQQEQQMRRVEVTEDVQTSVSCAEHEAQLLDLRERLADSERRRRALHNTVQDLKGHIRVFVRARPFLSGDGDASSSSESQLTLHQDEASVTLCTSSGGRGVIHNFSFDHTFGPSSSQADVFEEASALVQSVLDGYRVCIFSYGQTGSGKTHTMTGSPAGDGSGRGLIPRSIDQLLTSAAALAANGWTIGLAVTVLEIYNEDIRDLLAGYPASISNSSKDKDKDKIKIFRHPQTNRVMLSGTTSIDLPTVSSSSSSSSSEAFQKLFDYAVSARSTAHTSMNSTSSRSHFIVMVDITATSPAMGSAPSITLQGGLRLCDLAGSERLDRSNTSSDAARLKETVHINKSLSCLADVFLALSHKQPHVPYRNSKLTTLLQDCLSGEGKALMFVNVSPTAPSSQETLCSLRFAAQVSQVEMGKAAKSIFAAAPVVVQAPMPSMPPVLRNMEVEAQQQMHTFLPPPAPPVTASTASSSSSSSKVRFGFGCSTNDQESAMDGSLSTPRDRGRSQSRSRSPVPRSPAHEAGAAAVAQNKPLPMASFLSGNPQAVPVKLLGAGGAMRNLPSRRNSTLRAPPMEQPKLLSAQPSDLAKENEANKRLMPMMPPPALYGGAGKRELPATSFVDNLSAKRVKLTQPPPAAVVDSSAAAMTSRKFTWR